MALTCVGRQQHSASFVPLRLISRAHTRRLRSCADRAAILADDRAGSKAGAIMLWYRFRMKGVSEKDVAFDRAGSEAALNNEPELIR